MTTKRLGQEGFVWFFGVVEDREDPLKLGRVKVRIYDFHSTNKALMPTDQLPWAIIMVPPTNPSFNKVGLSPNGLTVGSTVVGFFMDGYDANQPVIMGTIHGIPGNDNNKHDVAELAREVNNLNKQYDSKEPESAYEAKYPYNKVLRTESGHVIELDDTPGKERIHIFHKTGSYTEIDKDGRKVEKVTGNNFEIVLGNSTVHINGNYDLFIDGVTTFTCNQINMTGNLRVDKDVSVGGDVVTDAGISHNNHTHTDTPGLGAGTTTPPN